MALAGHSADLPLADLLQANLLGRNTCRISVMTLHGRGTIFVANGAVLHATYGNLVGNEAFYGLLAADDVYFQVDTGLTTAERTIHGEWQGLILEAMRRHDEGSTPARCPSRQPSPCSTSVARRETSAPPRRSPLHTAALTLGGVVGPEEFAAATEFIEENSAIVSTVAADPNAVSYVGLGWVKSDVKAIPISGRDGGSAIAPSADTVRSDREGGTRAAASHPGRIRSSQAASTCAQGPRRALVGVTHGGGDRTRDGCAPDRRGRRCLGVVPPARKAWLVRLPPCHTGFARWIRKPYGEAGHDLALTCEFTVTDGQPTAHVSWHLTCT